MNKEDREELREMLEDVLKPITRQQAEHHSTLFGDGSEGNQGLRVDVYSLKQDRRRDDKHFWILYTGVVGVGIKAVWEWIRK